MLDFITWTADPAIFTIGSREIRWYGLAFAIGFAIGYMIVERMWKKEGLPPAWIDSLLIYTMLGTVIGARLGHCLFYAPEYYLANPIEIFKIWEGGLASQSCNRSRTGKTISERRSTRFPKKYVMGFR